MKVAVEWLGEYVDRKLNVHQMAEALERAGVEVDGIEVAANFDELILVGKVSSCAKHPNADKLKVCQVDIGAKSPLHIVCGAPNVAVGQTVAVAQVGAKLPDGMEIKKAEIRGQESQGMICSERELGLSESHEGILVLPEKYKIGSKLSHYLQQAEVIDVSTHPNRWDLQSIMGLGFEVAAHSDSKSTLKPPAQINSSKGDAPKVDVDGMHVAERYMMARVRVDNTKSAPDWMIKRLQASGVRPISSVVDITNYVLLEYGQPLHAFDADKVHGGVSVRHAKAGEKLTTLDGINRTLDPADIVIADENGPIGLAGVMGGEATEVRPTTSEILLEAATFPGATLRKTAAKYRMRTEASARFERGLPTILAEMALQRTVELLVEHAGAQVVGGVFDYQPHAWTQHSLTVKPANIQTLLGIEVDAGLIDENLSKLGFEVKRLASGELQVTTPWWRSDVKVEADIAEEVMRMIGYEALPATLPDWRPQKIEFDSRWPMLWRVKNALRGQGLFEVVTYSFVSEEQIRESGLDPKIHLKLQNPKSSEQAYLRLHMMSSLLDATARNKHYAPEFGMFEISKVYVKTKEGQLPDEQTHLAVMTNGPADQYLKVKQALDVIARELHVTGLRLEPADPKKFGPIHPTRTAEIQLGGKQIGLVGELHPSILKKHKLSGSVGYLEFDIDQMIEAARVPQHQEISKFPVITRDVAVVVATDVLWRDLSAAVDTTNTPHTFVSEYYGKDLPEGHKSVAIRLHLSAPDRTLTDKEADAMEAKAVEALHKRFKAQLRT